MATIATSGGLSDNPDDIANHCESNSGLVPLQAFFHALKRSHEEKAQRVVADYLADHGDGELIRSGYSAVEIQALRLEASIWLMPMI